MDKQNYFKSNTGTTHRMVGQNSRNALICHNSGGIRKHAKGSIVCLNADQLAQAKKCEKCFPNVQVAT